MLRPFGRLILHDAVVRTMDDAGTVASAIGFNGGRVVAVGDLDQVREVVGEATERRLDGAVVYPGFIDAHHHLAFAATYRNVASVRSEQCPDLDALLGEVRREAARVAPGEWVILYGYDEARLAERRRPVQSELDAAAPEHPVLLMHHSYHEGVLNRAGLERASLSRVARQGRVTEGDFGAVEQLVRRKLVARDRDGWFRGACAYQERVLAAGITHVGDAAVPPSIEELYVEWQRRGELVLGITMMPTAENFLCGGGDRLDGRATGWTDGRLSVGALKLFADGGTRCALCFSLRAAIVQFGLMLAGSLRARSTLPWRLASEQPSRLDRRLAVHSGRLMMKRGELEAMVHAARERGFDLAIHAGGNEAIEQAAAALEGTSGPNGASRIEHCFFTSDSTARRVADAGAHAVVQPAHMLDTGALVCDTGLPRGLRFHAYRTLLDAGVSLAGSSDAPVSDFDVLTAIATSMERRLRDGRTLFEDENLEAGEAIAMYTRGGAASLGMQAELGQLRAGARADAVMLSEDPMSTPLDRIPDIAVLATFAGDHEWSSRS